MSFDVAAEAYGRFMGVYAEPLAEAFLSDLDVAAGDRILDVGCGPGTLTDHLVAVVGPDRVSAVDPSEPFVHAARNRLPGVDVRRARAEDLPFDDASFDLTVAQLVVHFMTDPVAGFAEMARVTRAGGRVGASVWDHAGDRGPLTPFWLSAHQVSPHTADESTLPGVREGHLAELAVAAGLVDVVTGEISVAVDYPTFDDWWEPYTLGVGPAGAYLERRSAAQRRQLYDACRDRLGDGPFTVTATAWTVVAVVAAG